ncbi:MAG: hypothetical protein AUJ20_01360 [Comamonadaceae bacterium CG1_02_60_18]|nr:MAG: hypothetical protein AUJ20_01360 [Comamonadaceae bacterium CG1_02_60_18]PIQ51993.1 MAG: hypothetical protein COW02_11855 [Comamonadaceae bacterium CG12_big_fil_rev_8_21_14_0_65_59_15]
MKKVTKAAAERCAKHTLQEQLEAHRAELELLCKVETAIATKRIKEHYEDLIKGAEHGQDQGKI